MLRAVPLYAERYASSELPGPRCGSRFDSAMKTIEVNLPEPTAQQLGVTAEDLLPISCEEKLGRLDGSFRDAADYVISKNKELYKRLAQ